MLVSLTEAVQTLQSGNVLPWPALELTGQGASS
jgi:hypothetical protein